MQDPNTTLWNFGIVYGSPTHQLYRRLWIELSMHKRGISGPWIVAGDFNSVVRQEETMNYNAFSTQRSSKFVDWIHSQFTWKKGNSVATEKGARLDRARLQCGVETMLVLRIFHVFLLIMLHFSSNCRIGWRLALGVRLNSKLLG